MLRLPHRKCLQVIFLIYVYNLHQVVDFMLTVHLSIWTSEFWIYIYIYTIWSICVGRHPSQQLPNHGLSIQNGVKKLKSLEPPIPRYLKTVGPAALCGYFLGVLGLLAQQNLGLNLAWVKLEPPLSISVLLACVFCFHHSKQVNCIGHIWTLYVG